MAGFRLLDRVHREPPDRIGHTRVIDMRHDENPPEMRCLVAIRREAKCLGWGLPAMAVEGWIAPRFPESKAMERFASRKSCLKRDPDPKGRVSAKWKPVFDGTNARRLPGDHAQTKISAVHSSEAALRWPRLPRKFPLLNACRTADFAASGYGGVRRLS
jgi:hypothetical protein